MLVLYLTVTIFNPFTAFKFSVNMITKFVVINIFIEEAVGH